MSSCQQQLYNSRNLLWKSVQKNDKEIFRVSVTELWMSQFTYLFDSISLHVFQGPLAVHCATSSGTHLQPRTGSQSTPGSPLVNFLSSCVGIDHFFLTFSVSNQTGSARACFFNRCMLLSKESLWLGIRFRPTDWCCGIPHARSVSTRFQVFRIQPAYFSPPKCPRKISVLVG